MDQNNYSYQQLFGSLPPEYRMWYTTQLLMYNGQESGQSRGNIDGNEWPGQDHTPPPAPTSAANADPYLPQPNQSTDLPSTNQNPIPPEPVSTENLNINQWNYIYYLQMLSEMEQERIYAATHVGADSENNLQEDSVPMELYSSKVKKGLKADQQERNEEPIQSKSSHSSAKNEMAKDATDNNPEKDLKDEATGPSVKTNSKKSNARESLSFEDYKTIRGRLSSSPESNGSEDLYCKTCKSCSSPVLNNSFMNNSGCPSGNKCLLNVNNNLQKKVKHDLGNFFKPEVSETLKKEEILSEKVAKNVFKSKKVKAATRNNSQTNDEGGDGFENANTTVDGASDIIKNSKKNKSVTSKNRFRLERGKMPRHNQRKRHVDVERESTKDNLVAVLHLITATLRQLPSQPWFKYTIDSLASLMGVIIGSLWVLAFIVWEGLNSFYTALLLWLTQGFQWLRINGSSLVQMVFLYIPGLGGTPATASAASGESSKDESLPSNGTEAVRRLLLLKGQDPYSILGITPMASDEEIKRRYKSQAVLVHPDKNHFAGAEEAFKVLASAFDILGNTEKRTEYDREHNLRADGDEITSFLEKIQRNIEEMQSILGCQSCGKNHKRYKTDRQADSARYCSSCKTFHAAREGDLWAETTMLGFKWHYYAYLDKAIFDITEWVTCQADLITTVEANSHSVTCRLATPKGKNRNGAYSRMQDLKDLVNDLLQKSRQGGPEASSGSSNAADGTTKTDRANNANSAADGNRRNRKHGSGVNSGRKKRQ